MSDKPEVLLIDMSSLAHQIYHVSASEPDPDYTSKAVVSRVHAIAQGVEHVAVCCDSGRSFRHDLDPTYKANRPERDAILMHQMDLIREQLAADGFPVLSVPGYEADDLLATATALARSAGHPVMVLTADKDLLQLVTDEAPAVRCKNVQTGNVLDTEGVVSKLSVLPAQVCDYLCLLGDKSDNVVGAKGIGEKTAVELLRQFSTLDNLYENAAALSSMTPAKAASLREFKDRLPLVRSLIALKADAPIDPAVLLAPRIAPPMTSEESMTKDEQMDEDISQAMGAIGDPPIGGTSMVKAEPQPTQALVPLPQGAVIDVPYERQLDPRNPTEACTLADRMHASKLFLTSYGSPQAVLSTIMMGREMGIPAMTALRTIQIVKGRHSMSAQLMVGQVLKSGLVEYVEPVEITPESVTYRAKRKGRPEVTLTHTMAMAQQAGLVKPDSGWTKNPVDMLVARCSARICRIVAPDVIANVYTPEEIAEMREAA